MANTERRCGVGTQVASFRTRGWNVVGVSLTLHLLSRNIATVMQRECTIDKIWPWFDFQGFPFII